jgi:uncharacterized protein YdeI (YjbR/CyaY-like superfamily)
MEANFSQRDSRVDAYIAKSAEFAQPILKHLRKIVHDACPQVEETVKWGFPHFMYKGMLCSMAAFKTHCAFGFWKGRFIVAQRDNKNHEAMGQFGRITSIKNLPSKKQNVTHIRAAMRLNDEGTPSPSRTNRKPRSPLPVPAELVAALKRNKAARTTFDNFSPSKRREYIVWISEAKGDDTRKRRLTTTIEWLAAGKARNWKYMENKKRP